MRPLNIAHQCGAGLAPENTLLAARLALAAGADILDCDVRLSKDHQLVVIHDATVKRITGSKGRIADLTVQQLKQLDAGHFAPAYRGKGLTIPTLEEPFLAFPNARFNIHIQERKATVVEQLARLIVKMRKERQVKVASFFDSVIKRFRLKMEGVPTAATWREVIKFQIAVKLRSPLPPLPDGIEFQVPEHYRISLLRQMPIKRLLDEEFIQAAHSRNIEVYVWTVYKKDDMLRLLQVGVDGIFSNRPDLLREVLNDSLVYAGCKKLKKAED